MTTNIHKAYIDNFKTSWHRKKKPSKFYIQSTKEKIGWSIHAHILASVNLTLFELYGIRKSFAIKCVCVCVCLYVCVYVCACVNDNPQTWNDYETRNRLTSTKESDQSTKTFKNDISTLWKYFHKSSKE